MSGGYIQCGKITGDDKSGSAIQGVMEDILGAGCGEAVAAILHDMISEMDEGNDHILIEPDCSAQILPAVQAHHDNLKRALGDITDPFIAMEKDEEAGLDPIEAKWRKGIGWQFYCTTNLIPALMESQSNGDPVVIHFD